MPDTTIPDWVRHAVFYEVYPQTFYDTNGDGIGDLPGILAKLDYIESVGANALWLNPFYLSPMRDAGYDVQDYYAVDPRYGSLEDAKALFAECKRRGIRVIVDLVLGHTTIDHPWFRQSAQPNAPRPYRNWYIWTESAWDGGGDKWSKQMVHGYGDRDGNYLTNFFWSQPALNFGFAQREPDKPWQLPCDHEDVLLLRGEMRRIMRYWLDLGATGFRVDMADSLIRNDPERAEIRKLWREARQELEADFPEFFMIAEGTPSNLLDGTGFHSAYLHWAPGYKQVFRDLFVPGMDREPLPTPYFHASGQGDFRPYMETWKQQYEKTRGGGIITVPVGNHDMSRVAVGQPDNELEVVFAFQTAWPGIPFIFYGDELGMRQQSADNPVKEGHYPQRNGTRTPMHWDNTENCGFSTCLPRELYMPVDPDPGTTTVAAQETDPGSLLNRVRKLNQLHKETPAFAADAAMDILTDGAPGEPLIFVRGEGAERVLCYIQPKAGADTFALPASIQDEAWSLLASSDIAPAIQEGTLTATGPAWAYWKLG